MNRRNARKAPEAVTKGTFRCPVAGQGVGAGQAEPPPFGRPSDSAHRGFHPPTVESMRTSSLQTLAVRRADRRTGAVRVRAIRPTDAAELERFYVALSAVSRHNRFFAIGSTLSPSQSIGFCVIDDDHREGFIAFVDGGPSGEERIVGHLCLEPDGANTAEVAIAVADEFQHGGIARRLMAAGLTWARCEHIARFTATMYASNAPICRLLVGLGLPVEERSAGAGIAEVTIDLGSQSFAA